MLQAAWQIDTPPVATGRLRPGSGVLGRLFGPGLLTLGPSGGGGNRPYQDRDDGTDDAAETGETVTELLVKHSVLTEDRRRDSLRLTGEFRSDWRRRIGRVRDGERALMQLAMLIGVDPAEVQLEAQEDRFVAHRGRREIGAWPSRAAFLADVALYRTIGEWVPAWRGLDGEERAELLGRLRAFLKYCPSCEGDLQAEEGEGELRTDHVPVSIVCTECQQVVVTGSY